MRQIIACNEGERVTPHPSCPSLVPFQWDSMTHWCGNQEHVHQWSSQIHCKHFDYVWIDLTIFKQPAVCLKLFFGVGGGAGGGGRGDLCLLETLRKCISRDFPETLRTGRKWHRGQLVKNWWGGGRDEVVNCVTPGWTVLRSSSWARRRFVLSECFLLLSHDWDRKITFHILVGWQWGVGKLSNRHLSVQHPLHHNMMATIFTTVHRITITY